MLLPALIRVAKKGEKEKLGKKIAILVGRLGENRTRHAFIIILGFRCYSGVTACTEVFCVDIVLDTVEG